MIIADVTTDEIIAWTGVFTALFTGLTVVVTLLAIFKEQVQHAMWPVRIAVEWCSSEPTLTVHSNVDDIPEPKNFNNVWAAYLRLKITNLSITDARLVQVFIQSLEYKDGEHWHAVPRFVPMRLIWCHTNEPVVPLLTGETMQLCNFGRWFTIAHAHPPTKRPSFPNSAGRHFQLLTEVPEYTGNFIGPTNPMRGAFYGPMEREGDKPLPRLESDYRFTLMVAAEGGAVYKACWYLCISEADEHHPEPPQFTLEERQIYRLQQSRWPF